MSIRKRGNIYQVCYRVPGEKSPRTESFKSEDEALIRDVQIRLAKKNGTFTAPVRLEKGVIEEKKEVTIKSFLEEYVEFYGLKKWGTSYLTACKGLINNYIIPYIGECYVRSFTVKDLDRYYAMLLDKPAVVVSGHLDTGAKITAHTVMRIHKLLKSAFAMAVRWDYIEKNPTAGATLPTCRSKKRDVWSDDEAIQALNGCDDPTMRLCLYLALGCSLRMGEILGLQWSNVHMEPDLAAAGEAHIRIDRELKRCSNESIEALEKVNRSAVIFKFPKVMPKKATTSLVLKAPKTDSSNRTIYLPLAVVEQLREAKKQQTYYKELLSEEYQDFDLVVAQINGRPYEHRCIDDKFHKLIESAGLRPVVFHSLRHSSTSLKLKLSRGNVKAVQGDTGHAEARMVTEVYSRGFDADRKLIAKEMDSGFFSKVGEEKSDSGNDLMAQLAALVQENPDLVKELLAKANTTK